jgi:hypothetical protein
MANTFKKIQTVTVGAGGAASIDFTSIPQTYTDLKIVVSARSTYSALTDTLFVKPNGLTTNGSSRWVIGDGLNAGASSSAAFNYVREINGNTATASTFASVEIYAPNYTSSNYKSFSSEGVTENNAGVGVRTGITAGLWSSTAAITSITLTATNGDFVQYSTATLYGVANVPAAGNAKATGGIITYDDTYVYHTFPWSGTFTPLTSLTADYLVVAGGGGGAAAIPSNNAGGGGGAGGLRCTVGATGGGGSLESALSLTATAYTVTVGAGGAGGAAGGNNNGVQGSNSVFSTITSTGGGFGGAEANSGGAGGSGGGSGRKTASQTGGAGTANQGYNGGDSVNSGNYPGGGGGGAGALGANATTSNGGAGGNGVATSISGTSTNYGGGGGGGVYITGTPGAGGTGGGGAAGAAGLNAGNPGTVNTGGGGGGASINSTAGGRAGGAGGSGIVIVRYAR